MIMSAKQYYDIALDHIERSIEKQKNIKRDPVTEEYLKEILYRVCEVLNSIRGPLR